MATTQVAPFGLVIPGRPLITSFQLIDATKAIIQVDDPSSITEVTFFSLPNSQIPPGYGAILYYSVAPFQNWVLLGSITPIRPSGIFRTGFTTKDEVKGQTVVQFGVSLEPLETIENLNIATDGVEDRFHFAHKIALDLWQYLTSFTTDNGSATIVVPKNIFDRWLEKFNRRYKLDPNFYMKN